ncbi:hypothetical protein SDC9_68932 [bioreactor metagenome]|uniref:Uncharacterized protein n=1 Tax=bioreactor metagenome TaxID=1076179 RepID=A0A644Y2V3_9ZZZZ
MPRLSDNAQFKQIAGGEYGALCHGYLAQPEAVPVVQVDDGVHIVDGPRPDHFHGAARVFLGRLEDELHGAVEGAFDLRQDSSRAQHERHVAVVPAGVHHAVDFRTVRNAGGFFYGKRVQTGAQRDGRAGYPAAQISDDTCAADTCYDLKAQTAKVIRNLFCGAVFAKTELGAAVQVFSEIHQLGQDLQDFILHLFQWKDLLFRISKFFMSSYHTVSAMKTDELSILFVTIGRESVLKKPRHWFLSVPLFTSFHLYCE